MKEIIDYPYITFGVSDGGRAYQVPHRRPLPDRRHRVLQCGERGWADAGKRSNWRLRRAAPRFCAGFKDRGFLREGRRQPIFVIYDYEKARRRAGRDRARSAGQ